MPQPSRNPFKASADVQSPADPPTVPQARATPLKIISSLHVARSARVLSDKKARFFLYAGARAHGTAQGRWLRKSRSCRITTALDREEYESSRVATPRRDRRCGAAVPRRCTAASFAALLALKHPQPCMHPSHLTPHPKTQPAYVNSTLMARCAGQQQSGSQ